MRKHTLLLLFLLACCAAQARHALVPYVDGAKWGYADSNGKVVIAPKWEAAGFFENGRATVYSNGDRCIIDTRGKYIIPPWRHWNGELYPAFKGAHYNARGKDGKYGIIDGNGKEVIPCIYEKTDGNKHPAQWTGFFNWDDRFHTYAAKAMKNGKIGIIDTLNRTLIAFMYDGFAYNFEPDMPPWYYMVRVKNKYGLINTQNKMVIPPIYENIRFDQVHRRILYVQTDKKSMIADTLGNILVDDTAYTIDLPIDTLIPIRIKEKNKNDCYGLKGIHNQILIPCLYNNIGFYGDSVLVIGDSVAPYNKSSGFVRFYSRHTWLPISGWLPMDKVYPPQPPVKESKDSSRYAMHISDKLYKTYQKDSFTWVFTIAYWPALYYEVSGKITGMEDYNYMAIIDTNGNYVLPPVRCGRKVKPVNTADGLYKIEAEGGDTNNYLVSSKMDTLMKTQHSIASAFRYQSKLYVILTTDTIISENAFGDRKKATICRLTDSDGRPVKELEQYDVLWKCGRNGSDFNSPAQDGAFVPPYFMVRNRLDNTLAIMDMDGNISYPDISFRYTRLSPLGYGFFLADNPKEEEIPNYWHTITGTIYAAKEEPQFIELPIKGGPVMIDTQNHVMLDSLSIENTSIAFAEGKEPLFSISLSRPSTNENYRDVTFYMDTRGRAYHGKLTKRRVRKWKPQNHYEYY